MEADRAVLSCPGSSKVARMHLAGRREIKLDPDSEESGKDNS